MLLIRSRYKVLCFFIFLLCYSNIEAQVKKFTKRLNILWITCEDMSPHLSCYGEKTIQTPNIDALAAQGIRFTNVFTAAGVCAPSRSAIITGMYPTSIGTDNMRNYNPSAQVDNSAVMPSYSVVLPPQVKCFPEYLRREGYFCTNNAKQDYQFEAPVTVWDESSTKAHWRSRKKGQPFFAVFNLMITHESQLWQRENEPLLVDPAKVSIPPYYPDVPEVRHDIARNFSNIKRMDDQVGKIIEQLKEDGLYDETIIFFYSDHGDCLPFVKREVYDRGLRIPLIIRLPGGYKNGSTDDQMISGVDFAPTVLSLAGINVPRYMQGHAFLGAQATGKKREYVFAARDRMDTEYDRVRTVHDGRFQYVRNYMPDIPLYQDIKYRLSIPMMKRMLQMRDSGLLNKTQMMWFKKTKPAEELYDFKNDRYELNNLANNPLYKKDLMKLRTALNNWLKETGDANATPEKELVKRMWQGKDAPPQTDTPRIIEQDHHITITCSTEGASIGYKVITPLEEGKKEAWQVYNSEKILLQKGNKIIVRAQRIGFLFAEKSLVY